MCRDIQNSHHYLVFYDPVDHPIFEAESGGSTTLPFSTQSLVMESFDQAQSGGTGENHDVLPLFISFQNVVGKPIELTCCSPTLQDVPHTIFSIACSWGTVKDAALKKQITIRLEEPTIEYFRNLAEEMGMPYQSLINLYLRDCADNARKLKLNWGNSGAKS
jgi:uncharacterized protein (DUF4415 family)